MNSKLFVGMLLLAAGILLGWYMLGNGKTPDAIRKNMLSNNTPTGVMKKNTVALDQVTISGTPLEKGGVAARSVVTYTDTGFSPSPLYVEKGETVTFVNESSKQMLVASAVYPTHQILPNFVQKTAVSKGGIYEYTFVTIGTWKYQNDSNPADTGSIVVK